MSHKELTVRIGFPDRETDCILISVFIGQFDNRFIPYFFGLTEYRPSFGPSDIHGSMGYDCCNLFFGDAMCLGRVSYMKAKGMMGLMNMESLIINPFEIDVPLFSLDLIKVLGKYTLCMEMYDTLANENRKDVLFIDASKEFKPAKAQNELTDEHIAKIVDTYTKRKEVEKYSHKATLKEIEENDFNLNIPRYVDTFEEEDPVDIKAVQAEISHIDSELKDVEKQMQKYLAEILK